MAQANRGDKIAEAFKHPERIIAAMNRGIRAAVREHKLRGHAMATWRDGHVVWVPPEDLPEIPPEDIE